MQDTLIQAIAAGAIAALRKRAAHQRAIAINGTSTAEAHGAPVIIMTGEARVAERLAETLDAAADDIERGGGNG